MSYTKCKIVKVSKMNPENIKLKINKVFNKKNRN